MITESGSLRRAECSEVNHDISIRKRALGGKAIQTFWKAFIDAVFKILCKFSKFTVILVLNVANGRCPGCDYVNLVETCKYG